MDLPVIAIKIQSSKTFQMQLLIVISAFAASAAAQSAYDLAVVNGQQPAICPAIVQFNKCAMDAGNAMAACNQDVVDVPGLAYYQCLCKGQQQSQACYTLCPGDMALQA